MTATHFIIHLVGVSKALGVRRSGDFRLMEEHGQLCYQGQEFPIAQHNDLAPKVLEKYKDHMPRLPQVVLLDRSDRPDPAPKPVQAKPLPTVEASTAPTPEPVVPEGVVHQETGTDAGGEAEPPAPPAEVADDSPKPEPAKPKRKR